MDFNIIVAMDTQNGIGKDGQLPWHLSGDLSHFKEITTLTKDPSKKNAVIMGRKTWESIPERFRPLPNRINIVLTKNQEYSFPNGVLRAESLTEALNHCDHEDPESIFVIGGQKLFEEALDSFECANIYATLIDRSFDCDAFVHDFPKDFKEVNKSMPQSENGITYHFIQYARS